MTRLFRCGLFVLLAIALGVGVRGQQPPERSASAMRTAPGLETKLWAAEPMLANFRRNMRMVKDTVVWVDASTLLIEMLIVCASQIDSSAAPDQGVHRLKLAVQGRYLYSAVGIRSVIAQ